MNWRNSIAADRREPNRSKGVFKMVNKRSLLKNIFLCAAIGMITALSMSFPAAADDDPYSSSGSPGVPAQAAITKIFKIPINTPIPAIDFEFVFEKSGIDNYDGVTITDKMPEIPPVTISFDASDEAVFIEGDTMYLVKQSDSFITDEMIGETWWKNGEGVYKYTLRENMPGSADQDGITTITPGKAWAAYSQAVYDVEIWVEENEEGILYPKFVAVIIVENFEDEYYFDTESDETNADEGKVNPAPGTGETPENPSEIEKNYTSLIFTNKYWRTDGGGLNNPEESALEIIKKIEGLGADLTDQFEFIVTVARPGVVPAVSSTQTYKAVVLDATGNNVTADTDYTPLVDGVNGKYIEIESGAELKINLSHDQRLVFVNLLIGSNVEAKEEISGEYRSSYLRTFAVPEGFTGYNDEIEIIDDKEYLGFPGNSKDEGPHYVDNKEDEKENKAIFNNRRTNATPMGISVDDLPYIMMIGIAVICLIFFAAIKTRKKAERGHETYQQ